MRTSERIRTAPTIKAEMLPFGRVFAHGFLFFVQGVVVTSSSAIYHDIFVEANVLKPGQEELTPIYVGYFSGAYFFGKILSDFLWGVIRDSQGDKVTINITSIFLMAALVSVGFSWNLWSMLTSLFFVGLASGIFVPGMAFCNWIGVEKRETLVMWVYIFAGAGSLSGPFLGSLFFTIFSTNKLLKTFSCIAVMMLLSLLSFNYTFSDYDDRALIDTSKYTELLEEENNKIRESLDNFDIDGLKRKSIAGQIDSERLENIVDNVKYIESRKKLQNQTPLQILVGSLSRILLVLACSITWGVKLLEFMLFPIWIELSRKQGGLGFSNVATGAISLLNFPLMAILLLYVYKWVQKQKASNVMYNTALVMFVVCSLSPLVFFIDISSENLMLLIVPICSIKELANILWITSWSNLFTRLFPSRTLGRVFSWSFLVGHLILAILTQIYPRLLTEFIKNEAIKNKLGDFKITVFFTILIAPMLIVMILIRIAQKRLAKTENLHI